METLKTRISIFFDYVKDIAVFILVAILVIIVGAIILHNIIKIMDLPERYSGEYRNTVELENGDVVNLYVVGNGDKTIVILPGYGVQTPIIVYKNLAERLKNNYRVVIVEYPGYGFAKNTEEERTNKNIAKDIKEALELEEIFGTYILMPHSISNLYAMKFVELYPESVEAIISIDGDYPALINEQEGLKEVKDTIKNMKIASTLEYTGFARLLSYAKPETYYIDLMEKDEFINDEDIKIYRRLIGSNYLNKSMKNEMKNLEANMKELNDYKYPQNLPVLEILSTNTKKRYDEIYSKDKLYQFANSVISNNQLQKVVEINGKHFLNLSNPDEIVNYVNEFIY